MKILITGGAGYLGSILTETMLEAGYEVMVIDDFSHGVSSLAHLCNYSSLRIVRRHFEYNSLSNFLSENTFDAVLHLAAIVGAQACDANPSGAWRTNGVLAKALVDTLSSDTRVIYPCTNSGYGIGGDVACDETSPLKPLSIYGQSKVAGETEIMRRANSVSLRLATLFGWSSRMRRDLLVNDLVWRAVRDRSVVIFEGGFRRNFCHIRDAAFAFLHVLDNWDAMRGQIYNVGDTEANMTKLELCAKIQDHVPQFRFLAADVGTDPDKRDYLVSNAKIEATGWSPTQTLDEGIDELIKGYAMLKGEQYGNA